jgi:hypothetical protein
MSRSPQLAGRRRGAPAAIAQERAPAATTETARPKDPGGVEHAPETRERV